MGRLVLQAHFPIPLTAYNRVRLRRALEEALEGAGSTPLVFLSGSALGGRKKIRMTLRTRSWKKLSGFRAYSAKIGRASLDAHNFFLYPPDASSGEAWELGGYSRAKLTLRRSCAGSALGANAKFDCFIQKSSSKN